MDIMMEKKNKIQMLSKAIARVTTGLLIILPVISFMIWAKLDWLSAMFRQEYDASTFNIKTQAFGALFSLLPLSIWMYGLYNIRNLFINYAKGRVFFAENARYIKRFAWMSILGGGLAPIFGGVYSVILSMNHPVGERMLSVGLGTTEIQTLLLGLVFVVIAHVMEDAHALSEENNQFV